MSPELEKNLSDPRAKALSDGAINRKWSYIIGLFLVSFSVPVLLSLIYLLHFTDTVFQEDASLTDKLYLALYFFVPFATIAALSISVGARKDSVVRGFVSYVIAIVIINILGFFLAKLAGEGGLIFAYLAGYEIVAAPIFLLYVFGALFILKFSHKFRGTTALRTGYALIVFIFLASATWGIFSGIQKTERRSITVCYDVFYHQNDFNTDSRFSECIARKAVENRDVTMCYLAPDSGYREPCVIKYIAMTASGDVRRCSELQQTLIQFNADSTMLNKHNLSQMTSQCLSDVVLYGKRTIAACQTLNDVNAKDLCAHTLAIESMNAEYCMDLPQSIVEKYSDGRPTTYYYDPSPGQVSCVGYIANKRASPSLCDILEDELHVKRCKEWRK